MTIYTTVLMETLKTFKSDLFCCSCNIFYTQYHAVSDITLDEYADVFSYKGEILK